MWSLQTAWLGSFPGKNKGMYLMRALLQLGGALIAVGLAVFFVGQASEKK